MKTQYPTTKILFNRLHAFEILRHTSLNITHAGSLWMEAWASDADIETFNSNKWWYEVIVKS